MTDILAIFDLTPIDGWMILVSIGVFGLFLRWWQEKIFKPFLALFEAREKATVGSTEEADSLLEKATNDLKEFDQKLHQSHVDALQKKYALVDEAKKEAVSIVKKAEDESNKLVSEARTEIAAELTRARSELSSVVEELASDIVNKVTTPHKLTEHKARVH